MALFLFKKKIHIGMDLVYQVDDFGGWCHPLLLVALPLPPLYILHNVILLGRILSKYDN
jgi:hypothetical protein